MTNGNARIAEDLIWYWNWAEGEVGVPSNYSAMVNAMRGGGRSGSRSREIDEGRFAAATRMRLISRALQRLDPFNHNILFAAFGPHARELLIFEKAAPVAVLTKAARAAFQASHTNKSFEEWLLRLVHRASNRLGDHVAEDRATANAIAGEANVLLTRAMQAYSDAWRLRPGATGREQPQQPALRQVGPPAAKKPAMDERSHT
jgi:hypothetical protein